MMLPFISFIVSLIKTLFILKIPKFEVIIEYTTRITNGKNTQSSITKLDHNRCEDTFQLFKKFSNWDGIVSQQDSYMFVGVCVPRPQTSLLRTADAFRVTWSERFFETSAKCINREGLERRRQGLGKAYVISVLQLDFRLPAAGEG